MGVHCFTGRKRINEYDKRTSIWHQETEGRYYGRNNSSALHAEMEADRLRKNHFSLRHFWEGNFRSPIENQLESGAKVLDICSGPGTWLFDMSYRYKNSDFVGIETRNIFPLENVPENVTFIKENIFDGLSFDEDHFDFIHQRLLGAIYTQEQWEQFVVPELARVVKPLGWVEFAETDVTFETDSQVIQRLGNAASGFMKSKGMNPYIGEDLPRICEATGLFSDVKYESMLIPFGKSDDMWSQLALDSALLGFVVMKPHLIEQMNIMPNHYDALVEAMQREVIAKETCVRFHRICCQKKEIVDNRNNTNN